ncbi:type II toxin-antitoxin system HicA family toxin [bacterium]|nr:type II toxin-antitoxin system HicA family toxin [bacterium]
MNNPKKLKSRILSGNSDANIAFNDLRVLLKYFGFEERVKGSHHIYRKDGITEKINLQEEGNKAKPYQVKQIRKIIIKYKFGENIND